jgi:hypothetical protein
MWNYRRKTVSSVQLWGSSKKSASESVTRSIFLSWEGKVLVLREMG